MVLDDIFRSERSPLFDIVSCVAYDERFKALPSPTSLNIDLPPHAVSFCPDDPAAEAVALYAAALRNLRDGRPVTVVVDGKEAVKAINAIAFYAEREEETGKIVCRRRHQNLTILSSHELRGHETGTIIVATGAFDRAHLPINVLLERLIVILGRPRQLVEFILPLGDIVGFEGRRFSCLVQAIVSVRICPPQLEEPDVSYFTTALTARGYTLKMHEKHYICFRSDEYLPVVIIPSDSDASVAAVAHKKRWTSINVNCETLRATESQASRRSSIAYFIKSSIAYFIKELDQLSWPRR